MFFLRNSFHSIIQRDIQTFVSIRHIKRWVAPTLKELKKRREKLGPKALTHRSSYVEWNYGVEVFAFGKRLQENFDPKLLQTAFVHRSYILKEEMRQREVGIEDPKIDLRDNREFIKEGEKMVYDYVKEFLKFCLTNVPEDGIKTIHSYLVSEENLAHISSNIGTKDLALCSEFPVENSTLRDTLLAVIGALARSSGEEKAYAFIRDFICTQLNQKDLMEIWIIPKPIDRLKSYCKNNKFEEPEPRLIGESARNTVLGTFHVGMYSNKKLLGNGFGESMEIATEMAAIDSLRTLFNIHDNLRPYQFNVEIEKKDKQLLEKA